MKKYLKTMFFAVTAIVAMSFQSMVLANNDPNARITSPAEGDTVYTEVKDDNSAPIAEKITVSETGESIVIDYQITGPAIVLTALSVDGRLSPFEGHEFGLDTMPKEGFCLRVELTQPDEKSEKRMGDQWQVWHGVVDRESGIGKKTYLPVRQTESRLKAGNVMLPLNVEGVEAYLIPFRTIEGELDCIFVGIAKEKALLKETFKILPQRTFNWDTSFHPASTPLHPLTKSSDKEDK